MYIYMHTYIYVYIYIYIYIYIPKFYMQIKILKKTNKNTYKIENYNILYPITM